MLPRRLFLKKDDVMKDVVLSLSISGTANKQVLPRRLFYKKDDVMKDVMLSLSINRRFRKRGRRPQILQFCGDYRRIRRESRPRTCIGVYALYVGRPAKLQDLRPSPSFTKSILY